MLEDLSLRVDATDSKLTAANKRLKAFIRANEGSRPSGFANLASKLIAWFARRNEIDVLHIHLDRDIGNLVITGHINLIGCSVQWLRLYHHYNAQASSDSMRNTQRRCPPSYITGHRRNPYLLDLFLFALWV